MGGKARKRQGKDKEKAREMRKRQGTCNEKAMNSEDKAKKNQEMFRKMKKE